MWYEIIYPFPKLQQLHCWSLVKDRWFHPTLYVRCNYLSMLGLNLNHVCEMGPWSSTARQPFKYWLHIYVDPNLVINVFADALACDGAKPSAGTVLTTKLHLFLLKFGDLKLPCLTRCYHSNDWCDLIEISQHLQVLITVVLVSQNSSDEKVQGRYLLWYLV